MLRALRFISGYLGDWFMKNICGVVLKIWHFFMNFSFHEQAYYDLPAMTDYIINTTGQSKIFYVGHSRGSTMIYVLLSLRPEYNDKFHLILNFAPVVYLRNSRSPLLQTIFKASTLDIKVSARAHVTVAPCLLNASWDSRSFLPAESVEEFQVAHAARYQRQKRGFS